jgi:hypothetical protein
MEHKPNIWFCVVIRVFSFGRSLSLSLSLFLVAPTWSIGHPWNALFHFNFLILYTVGRTPWVGISPSQGRYLHKHRINADIHALGEIRIHDPSVRAREDNALVDTATCLVCVYVYFVCVVLCLCRGLATSWSLVQGVLPSVKWLNGKTTSTP